jgi:hypothetical protein
MSVKPQPCPYTLHGCGEAFLVQPFPNPFRPVAVKPVKRDTPPERVCLLKKGDHHFVIAAAGGCPRLVPECTEPPHIDIVAPHVQGVGTQSFR